MTRLERLSDINAAWSRSLSRLLRLRSPGISRIHGINQPTQLSIAPGIPVRRPDPVYAPSKAFQYLLPEVIAISGRFGGMIRCPITLNAEQELIF